MSLRTLAYPACPYCQTEQDFTSVGLRCSIECEGSTQAKIESARRNMDRKIAEERWVDPMTLENIIEEGKRL